MSVPAVITFIGLACILASAVSFFVAKVKDRNAEAWAFWSFLFPPLVFVLFFFDKAKIPPQARREEESRKKLFTILGD